MIIGTAGHIDHGKSALVEALTGRPVDRLAEERRRGITIELNFAPLDLGGGVVAGVVDVPGHEELVRTMVAGAAGLDVALLVVAADDGIMPQTREHRLVLQSLGVRHIVPVVTKADAVDADWLALVRDEVRDWLADAAAVVDAPIVTSARTGEGIDALRHRLAALADERKEPPRDRFRLPVDRVFSVAGTGTVVTGTPWSGSAAVGDEVMILPAGIPARIRSIESFGRAVERARPATRTAVGLAGTAREAIARGDILVRADEPGWRTTRLLDVLLTLDASAPRPLAPRTRVRLLLGTGEWLARVRLTSPIAPGAAGPARLALEAPIVARGGDRFVLRSASPVLTLGGGTVLDPNPPLRSRSSSVAALAAAADAGQRLLAMVARERDGLDLASVPIRLGLATKAAERALGQPGLVRAAGGRLLTASAVAAAHEAITSRVGAYHRTHPGERGAPVETIRREVARAAGPGATAEAWRELVTEGAIASEAGLVRLGSFRPVGDDAALRRRCEEVLLAAGLQPPTVAELAGSEPMDQVLRALRGLEREGVVEGVERDRFYHREALARFSDQLRGLGASGPFRAADVRDAIGVSRKYLIPLLEWADRSGRTLREGDLRRMHPRFA